MTQQRQPQRDPCEMRNKDKKKVDGRTLCTHLSVGALFLSQTLI